MIPIDFDEYFRVQNEIYKNLKEVYVDGYCITELRIFDCRHHNWYLDGTGVSYGSSNLDNYFYYERLETELFEIDNYTIIACYKYDQFEMVARLMIFDNSKKIK